MKKNSKTAGSGRFPGGQRPVVMRERHEKCPSCKERSSSYTRHQKAHLPTKTGVPIHDVASSCGLEEWHQEIQTLNKTFSSHQFLQKLLSLTWTCPYKQTNKTILPSFSLTKSAPKARWNVIILLIINIQFSEMQEQYRHFYNFFLV